MPAFLVVDTAIENSDEYEKYKALAKPITEQYGGVYRARGANMGYWKPAWCICTSGKLCADIRATQDQRRQNNLHKISQTVL